MSDPVSQLRLLSTGLRDTARAESLLQSAELAEVRLDTLLDQLSVAPDPDQALLLLIRLIERDSSVSQFVDRDKAYGLLRVLGASEALGECLIRRPEDLDIFRAPNSDSTAASGGLVDHQGNLIDARSQLRAVLLNAVGADPSVEVPVATVTGKDAAVALRIEYRRQLVAIALQDLTSVDPVALQPKVSMWLSDIATAALEAALAVSRAETTNRHEHTDDVTLGIIAMGKCGARELNYLSDVDVIFVHGVVPDSQLSADQAADIAVELAAGV